MLDVHTDEAISKVCEQIARSKANLQTNKILSKSVRTFACNCKSLVGKVLVGKAMASKALVCKALACKTLNYKALAKQ